LGLAECYLKQDQPEKAASVLGNHKDIVTQTKKRKELHSYYRIHSYVCFDLKKFGQAAVSMLKSFELASGKANDWLILGISYFKTHKDEKARQAFTQALQLNPRLTDAEKYLNRLKAREGETALKSKNYNAARKIFTAALKTDPYDNALKLNLALAEIGLKNWQAATDILLPMESALPDSYRYFYYTGYVMEKVDKYRQADRYYRKAYDITPTEEVTAAVSRIQQRLKNR